MTNETLSYRIEARTNTITAPVWYWVANHQNYKDAKYMAELLLRKAGPGYEIRIIRQAVVFQREVPQKPEPQERKQWTVVYVEDGAVQYSYFRESLKEVAKAILDIWHGQPDNREWHVIEPAPVRETIASGYQLDLLSFGGEDPEEAADSYRRLLQIAVS